jgi:hypothetical protein
MFISQLVLYFVDYLLVLLNTMCILLARGWRGGTLRPWEETGGKKRAGGKGRKKKGGKKRAGGKGREEKGGRKRAGRKGRENKTKGGRKRAIGRIRTRGWMH